MQNDSADRLMQPEAQVEKPTPISAPQKEKWRVHPGEQSRQEDTFFAELSESTGSNAE